jgi:hypothetical protein
VLLFFFCSAPFKFMIVCVVCLRYFSAMHMALTL